jgi:chromosomal replication initiator protein
MDRLRSRFEGGMVADISRPDYELRIAILQMKAEEKGITLPEDILNFMARSIDDNIRELEGALMQISTHAKVSGVMPEENEVAKILKVDAESKRQKTSPRELIQGVCKEFDVSIRDVRGKRRTAEIALPRQVCMYVLRKELELPLEQIARELGRSDHTTVMHAIDRVEEKMEEDEEFREKVEEMEV